MNSQKTRSLATAAVAVAGLASLAFAPAAFAQGESVADTTTPYSVTAPPNCCTYKPPPIPDQNIKGMHVYLWSGLKSHDLGLHDYPQFLADWSKILTEHGAVVEGGFHPPTKDELAFADVVVIYKGDAGFMTPTEHTDLETYVKRGGGLVNIHDSLCGPDPADMAALLGGGKRHGQINFTLEAPLQYDVTDASSPILADLHFDGFKLNDEAFYNMTWAQSPSIHVLANIKIPNTPSSVKGGGVGQVVPQIWTYEHTVPGGKPARAFVWMQGHAYANFANPTVETMLLRGIAWAGQHPVNELTDYKPPPKRVLRDPG